MSGKLCLDQVFYGSGSMGYGVLATSLADSSLALSAVNACLAIGQVPGTGLAKPVLLSRILGDRIVMARICNGARDSSGRNTMFVHALVASAKELRAANASAFSLAEIGAFRDGLSDSSDKPLVVDVTPSSVAESQEGLAFPAAIVTPEPDETLVWRVVRGKENMLSWSTFAYDDMPGYDVICLSPLASSPAGRNIYDAELRLVRGAVAREASPAAVPAPRVEEPVRPLRRAPVPAEGARKAKSGLLVPFLVSIAVNVVLLAVLALPRGGGVAPGAGTAPLVEAARQKFAGENRVTDGDLERSKPPLLNLFKKNGRLAEDDKGQVVLFHKLLAYRDFVEKTVLKQAKEK